MTTTQTTTTFSTCIWHSPLGSVIGKIMYATGKGLDRNYTIETIDGIYQVSVLECSDFE
jgi:hypothetical protein